MKLIIRAAVATDSQKILQFLQQHYYPEEPLTQALEPLQQALEDEEFNLSNIEHGTCVIAYEENSESSETLSSTEDNNKNDLIGVVIAGPKYIDEYEHLIEASETCESQKWSEMLKLLAKLEKDSNPYQHYNVTKAIHAHALAVHGNSRGKSIGMKLMQSLMQIGKELNFPLLTTDCTSIYTIRICEKLNMDCINEIYFKDYCNENGYPIFNPPLPHKIIKTFAKRI